MTAVWRYRLLLEAGRRVPACDFHSCCGEGRGVAACYFHSCCGEGRQVPACDSYSCCEEDRRVAVVIPIPAAGMADGCLSVIPSLSGTVVPVGGGMAGLPVRLSFIPSACMSLRQQASLMSGLSYRNLNQRDPLLRVFLVPYAVNVACAWLSGYLHAVLVHVSESLGECLVETLVRSYMLNA